MTEPWTDYFALPFAPLALLCQFVGFFVRPRQARLALSIGGWAAVTAMHFSLPEADPNAGVDIGGPLLALQWYFSTLVFVVSLVVEVLRR